jgi:flagellar protein FlaG
MTSTAPISGPTPDTATAQAPASTGSGASQTPPAQSAGPADLRLVIEDDKAAGCFVYMTVNPITGEVVSQVPREQLLKMRTDPDYAPGSVINSIS